MTDREILETRIKIAKITGFPPDNIDFLYDSLYSKPYWFFISEKEYSTMLFFSEKPSYDEIEEEIQYMEEAIDEWDFDDLI